MTDLIIDVKKLCEEVMVRAPLDYSKVEVNFGVDTPVFKTFIKKYYMTLGVEADARGFDLKFSLEDLTSAIEHVLFSRITYVRGERAKEWFRPTDTSIYLPSALHVVFSNIGKAEDKDIGVYLEPKFVPSKSFKLDFEKAKKTMAQLAVFEHWGFTFARGFLRDKKGDFEFMTMQLIETTIMRHNKEAHPVKALLASFFLKGAIESVLTPRVTYGNYQLLERLVENLVSPRSKMSFGVVV